MGRAMMCVWMMCCVCVLPVFVLRVHVCCAYFDRRGRRERSD